MVTRTLIVLVACFAMWSCSQIQLIILTNATAAPIRVRYAVPRFRPETDALAGCELRVWPPQVRPTPAENLWPASEWRAVDVKFDEGTCEVEFVVEPGHSALLDRNGYCNDYMRHADLGAALRPSLESLVLESGGRLTEWRGWDAVKQFRRTRRGHCIYRVS